MSLNNNNTEKIPKIVFSRSTADESRERSSYTKNTIFRKCLRDITATLWLSRKSRRLPQRQSSRLLFKPK